MRRKLYSVFENNKHPLHSILAGQRSSCSERLICAAGLRGSGGPLSQQPLGVLIVTADMFFFLKFILFISSLIIIIIVVVVVV